MTISLTEQACYVMWKSVRNILKSTKHCQTEAALAGCFS